MAPTSKLVLAAKLLNITLAATLVLLANDVSSNPGPATSLPFEAKGLRAFHINICSLRNKMASFGCFVTSSNLTSCPLMKLGWTTLSRM